jgi:transposase-like protein
MIKCKDCGHDYNEFTSHTPASERQCDDCFIDDDSKEYRHERSIRKADGTLKYSDKDYDGAERDDGNYVH